MRPTDETYGDALRGFAIPARDARGRVARLDAVVDEVLAAHDYPPAIAHLLAEALVLAALLGSLVKGADGSGSQLTMQAHRTAEDEPAPVRLLVCDYQDGALRGYVDFDEARLGEIGGNAALPALFGAGYLAITFDEHPPGSEPRRYQGIVPLEGASLSEAVETYFVQSEQVPTLVRTAVSLGGPTSLAGGLLVQHLPEGEEGRERLHARLDHPEWEHVDALARTIRHDELADPALSLEAIVWRLFHEEDVRVHPPRDLSRGCRCTPDHYRAILSRFPEEERLEMRDGEGNIVVDCAFCARSFALAV